MLPLSPWEKVKRCSQRWAEAEAEVFGFALDPLTEVRWVRRVMASNIPLVERFGGFRKECLLDLTADPAILASKQSVKALNHHLRSLSAALWLCELIARPETLNRLGDRVYGPEDCRPVMFDARDMLSDQLLWCWSYRFGVELSWRWRETHRGKDHKGTRIIIRLNPHRDGAPSLDGLF